MWEIECDSFISYIYLALCNYLSFWIKDKERTLGANVALESSCTCAFDLAEPSSIEGSSWIKSLDPTLINIKIKKNSWLSTYNFAY